MTRMLSHVIIMLLSQEIRNMLVAGMYTMRLLDSNNSNNASSVGSIATALHPSEERMDASSDSAVSSMGSERVPSLSDGEWMETGSDSGHTTGDHYSMDYHARCGPEQIYINRIGQHIKPCVNFKVHFMCVNIETCCHKCSF